MRPASRPSLLPHPELVEGWCERSEPRRTTARAETQRGHGKICVKGSPMKLEDEVKMLRRMRQDVITAARDMKAALLDLYAPRQTPRPEVLTAVQLLASGEGFDAECPNHACRRT